MGWRHRPTAEELLFWPDDPAEVLARMELLAESKDGWVNLQPGVNAEDLPPPPGPLAAIMGGKMVQVPVCTWVPARHDSAMSATVGVEHGMGERVLARLREAGAAVPEGWVVRQDHPRRGLVIDVEKGAEIESVVSWLVAAGTVLSRSVELTGQWRAIVYARRVSGMG